MSDSTLSLSILLTLKDEASSALHGVGTAISGLFSGNPGQMIAGIGQSLMAVGTVAVGVAAQSVKMAGDFQESMTQLVTGAGESKANLKMVSDGILNMAVSTGTSTQQLSAGMYMIESAGYHGAQGLQVLQTAAEGSKVGNADLGVVANTLTTVLTDYHMKTSQASQAMNGLITTVASGKTHLQDLATSMGSVLPLASSLGISFPQVGGAIATMTNAGMDARRAAMNLANSIRSLAAPNSTAVKSMTAVGLSAQQLKDTLSHQGLTAALQLVEEHVGSKFPAGSVQAVTAFKNIMGGATGYNVALMLGGKNMKEFEGNVKNISSAMQNGKGTVQGWSEVQGDFNFKVAQAKEVLETLMIRIGQALLPVLTQLMNAVMPLITSFSHWITNSGILQQVVHGLTSAIMPVVTGFVHWLTSGHNLQNALAQVGTVVKQVGGFVLTNLVQPIAHLVKAILDVLVPLGTWLVKSGTLHTILLIVGTAIGAVFVVAGKLVGVIATVIEFFAKNHDAAAALLIPLGALGGYLVYLAVTAVGNFLATLPTLLTGFMGWAAGLIPVMIETLATIGPYLLIGAIVGAVVFGIVEAIRHWGAISAWLKGAWSAVIGWLGGALNAIGAFFRRVWDGIIGFLRSAWKIIVAVVKVAAGILLDIIIGPVGMLVIYIITHWAQVKQFFITLWNDITGIFRAAWGGLSSALTTLWNNVRNFFANLPAEMLQFGKNLIQGLINGITGMLGNIGNAMHTVTNFIGSFLPHSPAKQGELAHLNEYGPSLVQGIAGGIQRSAPALQASLNMLLHPVSQQIASAVPASSALPQLPAAGPAAAGTTGQGGVTNITINYTGSGKTSREQAQELLDEISRLLRLSGQQVATASGRRY